MNKQNTLIWEPGETILGIYEVREILGKGGMGLVQRVHHKTWNLDLAVKSPKANIFSSKNGLENFIREAETWVSLGLHPHIVDCYYVRVINGIPRVFVELVDGGSVKDWIDSKRLYEGSSGQALTKIIDIAIQIAWGLHFAHESGLVHQDVKPANVMMTSTGVAKVTDFGLAKARFVSGEQFENLSKDTVMVTVGGMTPAYCSPEQSSSKRLSRRTDIWSWAVSVLHMLTGEIIWSSGPLAGLAFEEMVEKKEHLQVPVPVALAEILIKCLSYDPSNRPNTLLQVADELKKVYQQVTQEEYSRTDPDLTVEVADRLNNQALSLLDLGKDEKALEIWDKAINFSPLHLDSIYNAGLVKWRKGVISDTELIRLIQNARQLPENETKADYLEAQIHAERGDFENSSTIIEKALSYNSQPREIKALQEFIEKNKSFSRSVLREIAVEGSVKDYYFDDDIELALVSSKNSLDLWDLKRQMKVRSFDGHTMRVFCAAFSNDGRLALSGCDDMLVRLWDIESGKCLKILKGHQTKIASVAFRSDDLYALSSGGHGYQVYDDVIRLWDLSSGDCLGALKGHGRLVKTSLFSRSGRYALSGSWDCTLRLWDLTNGECVRLFEGHKGWITSADISDDSRFVLSGSEAEDYTVKLWDVQTGECLKTMKNDYGVSSVSFSPDYKLALSAPPFKLWDLETGRCLATFESNNSNCENIRFSKDGNIAIYSLKGEWSSNKTVVKFRNLNAPKYTSFYQLSEITRSEAALQNKREFDSNLQQAVEVLQNNWFDLAKEYVEKARFVPGFERHPQALKVWSQLYKTHNLETLNDVWEVQTFKGHDNMVEYVEISKDNRFCLTMSKNFNERTGKNEATAKLWNIFSGEQLNELDLTALDITSATLSNDGSYILSGGKHHAASVWNVRTGECLWIEQGKANYTFELRKSHDSDLFLLITSTDEGKTRFIQLRNIQGEILNEIVLEDIGSVNFSPDGNYFIASKETWNNEKDCSECILELWNLSNLTIVKSSTFQNKYNIGSLALTPDNNSVLLECYGGDLELRDVSTGILIQTFTDYFGSGGFDISSDGKYVIAPSNNSSIKIWNLKTGDCIRTLLGHSKDVRSVFMSIDQQYILSGSYDTTAKLWFLNWKL